MFFSKEDKCGATFGWLPFQLTLVNTLRVGVGVRTTNVLSIDRHMIDQRALFYQLIGI